MGYPWGAIHERNAPWNDDTNSSEFECDRCHEMFSEYMHERERFPWSERHTHRFGEFCDKCHLEILDEENNQ